RVSRESVGGTRTRRRHARQLRWRPDVLMQRVLSTGVIVAALTAVTTHAQSPSSVIDTSAKAVIPKSVEYLKAFKDTLQFGLAGEATSQDVLGNMGRRVGHRETSGEFFLTYLAADRKWVGVRDIAMVDGVAVEKRDNLRELLNKATVARIARQL